jgi:hypothetical protein
VKTLESSNSQNNFWKDWTLSEFKM